MDMVRKETIAMLLAGGEGKRLGVLTKDLAKPAVHYGGKYRIIDYTLSNCVHSGIDTVGVLTQYQPLTLSRHLGIGSPWGLDRRDGGMSILPPYMKSKGGSWYKGTANAIYQNMGFIDRYDPENVLIISGDHIYKMNYARMIAQHKASGADATIAVIEVDLSEASRFGIMNTGADGRITEFEEKPKRPRSNLASMGVYVFSWPVLQHYLLQDESNPKSSNDFGKDIIPAMLAEGLKLCAYRFDGYWKDVGTIQSLWDANMDLLKDDTPIDLGDKNWRIYTVNPNQPAHYIAETGSVSSSLVTEGCFIEGEVSRSVLFHGVQVGSGTVISESVIMPNAVIGRQVTIHRAIIGEDAVIEDGVTVGSPDSPDIQVVASGETIAKDMTIRGVQA
jgi:glucose-1-phosphate adenylyltransferase